MIPGTRSFFLLVLFLPALSGYAQSDPTHLSDTTYFDAGGRQCIAKEAMVYRLVSKKDSATFLIKDYYIKTTVLQMEAECSSVDPEIKEGKATYYLPNGERSHSGLCKEAKFVGVWTFWDNPKDSTLIEFKDKGETIFLNKGRYINYRGTEQFIITEGTGKPTVVFIAGKGRSQADFRSVYKAIKNSAQIFAYDRAGIGQSEFLPSQRSVDTMAYELHVLLKKAKVTPPYLLVGQSLGGMVARCYASMYPKEVKGMVLIDPAHEEDFMRMKEIRSPKDKLKFCLEYEGYRNRSDRSEGHNAESACAFDTSGYSKNAMIMKKIKFPTTIPVTVITSAQPFTPIPYDMRDLEIKYSLREDWKKQASQIRHVTTRKSGHYIQLQEPDLVIEEIKKVLAAIPKEKRSK